jgi:hypothetical protein
MTLASNESNAARRARRAVRPDGFHIDACLDRVAARRRIRQLIQPQLRQGRSPGEPDLGLHEIDPGHRLGHGMLYLKPRIRFDEHEWRRAWLGRYIDQELECPEIAVADALRKPHRGVDDPAAENVIQTRCGSNFDDLLKAALDAALTLGEMSDVTCAIAEDLHLDMTHARHELFDIDIGLAERGGGLGSATFEGRRDLVRGEHGACAATTAAGDGLDDHCTSGAEGGEEPARFVQRHRTVESPQHRHGCRDGSSASACLVAEQLQMRHVRSDEGQSGVGASLGEIGAFGQEAVAGMDGVTARLLCRGDNRLRIQIGSGAASGQRSILVGYT